MATPGLIKPFKIIETRNEADGAFGVIYEVWHYISTGATNSVEERMQGYMTVPKGMDIDTYVFGELSKAGWF